MKKKTLLYPGLLFIFLFCTPMAFSQGETSLQNDPSGFIGLTLSELIDRFGIPRHVYPVRRVEAWQDDVVFVYDSGEFFVVGDRVWQLRLRTAYNVRDGDTRAAVTRTLGEGLNFDGYTLYQLPSRTWPLMLRINWNAQGRAAGIYIFRSDF
jgi:hypothetical protein